MSWNKEKKRHDETIQPNGGLNYYTCSHKDCDNEGFRWIFDDSENVTFKYFCELHYGDVISSLVNPKTVKKKILPKLYYYRDEKDNSLKVDMLDEDSK
jgi:hypothetical protein